MEKQGLIKKIYFGLGEAGSLAGVARVFSAAKKIDPDITYSQVKKTLSNLESYSLHKPVKRIKKTRPYLSSGINEYFQMDLFVMNDELARANRKRYVLFCIDSFSRKIFARPLLTKTGVEVRNAIISIFQENDNTLVKKVVTDKGTEFLNYHVQDYFKKMRITHITSENLYHAAMVERLIGSFRRWLGRFITGFKTKKFLPFLQKFVDGYNNSAHSSLPSGMSPSQVCKLNEFQVWQYQYSRYFRRAPGFFGKSKFKLNDIVLIRKIQGRFKKASQTTFSNEKFIIVRVLHTIPITYKIATKLDRTPITGSFYSSELQKIEA